jgi:hypothetical protein
MMIHNGQRGNYHQQVAHWVNLDWINASADINLITAHCLNHTYECPEHSNIKHKMEEGGEFYTATASK